MISLLLVTWVVLGAIHLGVPVAYVALMRRVASKRDYQLVVNEKQKPTVSILIPTYNEATVIERKLDNISQTEYPLEKIEIIVIDGASTDNTPALAKNFIKHSSLNAKVIEESERKGKAMGLNSGLAIASGALICISDAECLWDKRALKNAVKYFADPSVGSVSGVHQDSLDPTSTSLKIENSYRSIYRTLRIAESKLHSTPVGEGEIQLFRRSQLTGFDPTVGADDTAAALGIVKRGLRAISAEDVIFQEPTPSRWLARLRQKIRRGQHVLQAFVRYRSLLSGKTWFSRIIFPMEFFLYIVNPLIFVPFVVLTIWIMTTSLALTAAAISAAALTLLLPKTRTIVNAYFANNLTMLAAIFQEIRGEKQLKWTKIEENRPSPKEIAPVPR